MKHEAATLWTYHCSFRGNPVQDMLLLECRFFHFSFEYRVAKSNWIGPVALRFREPSSFALREDKKSIYPHQGFILDMAKGNWAQTGSLMRNVRDDTYFQPILNASWHCSWCFAETTMVVNKIQSYTHHKDFDREKWKRKEWILERYRTGQPLFAEAEIYEYSSNNKDIPGYIHENSSSSHTFPSNRGARMLGSKTQTTNRVALQTMPFVNWSISKEYRWQEMRFAPFSNKRKRQMARLVYCSSQLPCSPVSKLQPTILHTCHEIRQQ